MTDRGYCQVRLPNLNIFLKITRCFFYGCNRFNKKTHLCKKLAVTDLRLILTPTFITVHMFALVVPYFSCLVCS